jgi:hypothetical protein
MNMTLRPLRSGEDGRRERAYAAAEEWYGTDDALVQQHPDQHRALLREAVDAALEAAALSVAPSVSQQETGERCPACGVSKQQVLRRHDEAADLVRRAAPFVNAVAVMADDKAPALRWLADAAGRIEPDEDASVPFQQQDAGEHDLSECLLDIEALLALERMPALADGGWEDGHELTCPGCGACFVHVCDEVEGCSWRPVVDSAPSQQEDG